MDFICINISAFISDSDNNKKPDVVVANMHTTVEVKANLEGCSSTVIHSISFARFINELSIMASFI